VRDVSDLDLVAQSAKEKSDSIEPLSQSSMEAYTGIAIDLELAVFHMTWWMRIPLFLILCIV
jgi:hypothetical protein